MTASWLFSVLNVLALSGWVIMVAGILIGRPLLRDNIAGVWIPVMLSAVYAALIIFFFGESEGGFDTLENVQLLFADPWIALGGWVHYLAFDMFMGSRIARQTMELGLPRWILIGLLPLTFLFGPIGYLAFEGIKAYKKGSAI